MVVAKKLIYAKQFDGMPKLTDFQIEEETLSELNDGEVLAEAVYISIDPFMRGHMMQSPCGVIMIGGQVAKIIKSKNANWPQDSYIYGMLGCRTHTVFNPNDVSDHIKPYILPSFGKLPLSLGLGHLGVTGLTAYFGFLDICAPKKGEVVVVSGAAGAVGSVVGQIAKIKGCKVIGIAGSDAKCTWLSKDLGFDHVINYKTESVAESLKKIAPDGIDCFFDNVGGDISSTVFAQMRELGRISVCGSISLYNLPFTEWPTVPLMLPLLIGKQMKIQGFLVNQFWDKWFDGIDQLQRWTNEGKLKYKETVTNGFENIPHALIDLLNGKNVGKSVVKIS